MGLLMPHTGTVIWMLIGFLTVFFLLKKFAWKPVLSALKQRENSIGDALKAAEAAKQDMERLNADNERIIAEAKQERDKIVKEARELKESIVLDAKEQASADAEKLIETARANIKAEKEAAIKDIKDHVAQLSISISEKLLQEKLSDSKEQKDLIDRLLREVKTH
ncbi:MAG: F0F1 ATP synthase subunit B [Bacteroidales bacterium]|jgi:F-type H+-transporting ATPase subunit b